MSPTLVLVLLAVSCLAWSAACVAAAARADGVWTRRLLVALAVVGPMLAMFFLGLVRLSVFLVALRFTSSLYAPLVATCLAALIGAIAIPIVGLSSRPAGGRRAAGWPALGLFVASIAAAASATGVYAVADGSAAAEPRALRAEAARIMAAALPPTPAADDDAGPLYARVFAALEADSEVSGPQSRLDERNARSPETTAILGRQAATLDLLRQAADRPACRFQYDWSKPSLEMELPEAQAMRMACRVLAAAARAAAEQGDVAAALADVVRIGRMGRHLAETPLLVAGATSVAIHDRALEELAAVLPLMRVDDAHLLDNPGLLALLEEVPLVDRHVAGEEATTLTVFADLAEGRYGGTNAGNDAAAAPADLDDVIRRLPVGWRCFMMPTDLRFAKETFARIASLARSGPAKVPVHELTAVDDKITDSFTRRRPGLVSALMVPACLATVQAPYMAAARGAAAQALVAVTRERLANGAPPDSLSALVPGRMAVVPRDPFKEDAPLRSKRSDDGWVVWSVGPDGEDDGGPQPSDAEPVEGNDDVGLRMRP